jgi:hypothetical protein
VIYSVVGASNEYVQAIRAPSYNTGLPYIWPPKNSRPLLSLEPNVLNSPPSGYLCHKAPPLPLAKISSQPHPHDTVAISPLTWPPKCPGLDLLWEVGIVEERG